MSNQKIKFGNYSIVIEPKKNFSNAVLNSRRNTTPEYKELCSYLDKELSRNHIKQNLKKVKGDGKVYWGKLNERDINKLENLSIQYNEDLLSQKKLSSPTTLPEEILNPEKYREGTTKLIPVNVYERNLKARKKCIEHYGYNCSVCDFNFGETFGELGEGFIHVHHLKPLSEIGQEYTLDPINDLRPVCPNCHCMLHRQTPILSIEELISIKKLTIRSSRDA